MQHNERRGDTARRRRTASPARRPLRLALLLGCTLLSAGCASLVQAPDVRLASLRLVGLGLRGGSLEAGVVVSNPNRYALESEWLAYDLELADPGAAGDPVWRGLANGRLEREIRIPGKDSLTVAIPIDFTWDAVGGALRSLLEKGTFDYRVSGELVLRSPIRKTIPYRRTGTLPEGR